MTNGEKELNPHYREAVELAKEKGVLFRDIDISKDREEQRLEPLSREMKKGLCRRALFTYCENEQYGVKEGNYAKFASEFIENNYEELTERKLKMLPEAKQELKTVDNVDNKDESFMKSLQDLKKDDKESVSNFEEQNNMMNIQKKNNVR